MNGSGLKQLKEKNLMSQEKIEKVRHECNSVFCVPDEEKKSILERCDRDSQFLKQNRLMDYSLLAIQINKNQVFKQQPRVKITCKPNLIIEWSLDNSQSSFEYQKMPTGYAKLDSKCKNFKFKFCVIDFLTRYTAVKVLDRSFKMFFGNVEQPEDVSAVDEDTY